MTGVSRHYPRVLVAVLLAALVGGCAGVGQRRGGVPPHPVKDVSGPLQWPPQARRDMRRAESATDPQRAADLRLRAVAALLDANDLGPAKKVLRYVGNMRLNVRGAALRAYMNARLALKEGRPHAALRDLKTAPRHAGRAMETKRLEIRARAETALGAWPRVVTARGLLAPRLRGAQKTANQEALWAALQRLPFKSVSRPPPPVPGLKGWYALAYLVETDSGEPYQLQHDLRLWGSTYPNHPAKRHIVPRLWHKLPTAPESPPVPAKVALLLPESGPLAPAGRAVAQGFKLGNSSMKVTVYDTRGNAQGAVDAYQAAASSDRDWVVGPLESSAVEAVAGFRTGRITDLALNKLPDTTYGNPQSVSFYQFSLGPRADARAVAQRALADGRQRAALLYADTSWGQEAAADFRSAFRRLGGQVVAFHSYPYHGRRLGRVVKRLLEPGGARPLWRDARGPRARSRDQRIDMLFLVADPRDARLIKPLLLYYHAMNLPVYATSQLFSGQRDPRRDQDLDGITFCAMPFLLERGGVGSPLRAAARDQAPEALRRSPRLMALGADSALLVRHLHELRTGEVSAIDGATGRLGLLAGGRISRELTCARFRDGEPVILAATDDHKTNKNSRGAKNR